MTLRELIRSASIIGCAGILSAEAAGPPYAFTQPHWAVTATLNGMAAPNGLPSTAWFEWGETSAYGQTTAPVSVGESTGVVRVSATVSNLVLGQVYHARLVVSNAAGVAFGADQPLITAGSVRPTLLGSVIGECAPFPVPVPRPCGAPVDACTYSQLVYWTMPQGVSNVVAVSGGGMMLRADGTMIPARTNFTNIVAISGTSLALRADGTVLADSGHLPTELNDAITIATDGRHKLALRSDGTIVAWGNENSGPTTNVPPGLSNVVAIAAGSSHSLALRVDGTVVAWGYSGGETNVPPGLTNVVAIAASYDMSLALRSDGTVVAWPDAWTNYPPGLTGVIAIAASSTAFALRRDGTVVQWHPNSPYQDVPFHMRYLTNIVVIAAAGEPALALGANQPPVNYVTPLSSYGFQDRDLVISLGASDANGDALSFRITSLPGTGTLYQYENGARGAPILAPQTWVADPESRVESYYSFHACRRVIYAPDADDNDLAPSFAFVANDGELDSGPIPVTISLVPMFPRIKMNYVRGDCGGLLGTLPKPMTAVTFVGNTNSVYRVWASTNLLDWQVLGSASGADSVFGFTDYETNLPMRFYKVSTP